MTEKFKKRQSNGRTDREIELQRKTAASKVEVRQINRQMDGEIEPQGETGKVEKRQTSGWIEKLSHRERQ